MVKKVTIKRVVALAVSLLLMISTLQISVSAATNTNIVWLVNYGVHSTLANGYIYRVDRNITYNASTNQAALYIQSGATVVIDIPAGYTLTVVGGAGSSSVGGAPGIYLPSNSTLIITGAGRLNATGGRGGNSRTGGDGGYGYVSSSWYYKGGDGGSGGYGGGGGGAGIGTYGGSGGSGGSGGYMSEAYCPDGGGNNANAVNGSSGRNGNSSAASGILYVLGNTSVYAYAGSGASAAGGGSNGYGNRRKAGRYWTAGGGSGGGGGGAGYSARNIGSGGPGGGGGGGGASGGRWSYTGGFYYDVGYAGNGGSPNGANGCDAPGEYQAGYRASGGASGSYGSNGAVYKSTTSYIYNKDANGSANYCPSATLSNFYFDRQGGSGGTSSIAVNYGCPIANITIPTRSMYTFMGYYTGTNGTGLRYIDHRGVSASAYYGTSNVTLYAYWVQSQFNITLNKQGGSGGSASVVTTGTNGTLPSGISLPSKTHFAFRGYFQNAAGQGTQYYTDSGAATGNSITTNTSIYAYWVQNQFQTIFNMQNGTGGTSSAWTTGTDGTLPSITTPTRIGYVFGGYYTGTNGTGTQYYNGSGVAQNEKNTAANGKTLYAKWTPAVYNITYNMDGGTNHASNPKTRSFGATTVIQPPTKQDYIFMGWQIDDGTQRYTNAFELPAYNTAWAKNITLTATWLRSTITDAEIRVVGDGTVTNSAEIKEALESVFDYIVTDNEKGITASDMAGDKSVKLVLTVTASSNQNEKTQIIEAAQGTALKFYDLKVRKEVVAAGGSTVTTNLVEIPIPITVKIAATGELANKPAYAVYRIHDESTEKLPIDPQVNGEYYDSVGNEIVISTRKFSTYGIVGTTVAMTNTGGTEEGFYGSQGVDVQGRVVKLETEKVYKLDISWGEMKFEYSLQSEWDPETHMYTEGALNYWRNESHNGINNKVSVKNHSNGDVRVNFAVASQLDGVAMGMHIYNEKTAELAHYFILEDAPANSNDEELVPCEAYLFLEGIPTANWLNQNKDEFTNVGVITVTAEEYPDA